MEKHVESMSTLHDLTASPMTAQVIIITFKLIG